MSSPPERTLPSPGQSMRFPSAPPRPRSALRPAALSVELAEAGGEWAEQELPSSSGAVAELTDVLAPGTRAGEYVLGALLGQGGFGQVYEAVHPVIGKRAAVKVLARELADSREQAARFVNEARAVNAVRHRNVVDVFAFGRLPDGRLYLVMEMLEGETLQAYLARRGRLELNEALQIFGPLGAALEAVHGAGIVHRDLKPANVILAVDASGELTPKILDFGVAKMQLPGAAALDLTGEGKILGTPTYMAPEQSLGGPVSPAADVYALGVMLHRALTGRLPFERTHALGMAVAHATMPPPAMSEVAPELPVAMDAVILRMLAKDAPSRPQSASAALRELEGIAREHGLLRFEPALPTLPAASELDVHVSLSPQTPDTRQLVVPPVSSSLRSRKARSRGRSALYRRARRSGVSRASTRRWARIALCAACLLALCCLAWTHYVPG